MLEISGGGTGTFILSFVYREGDWLVGTVFIEW